MTTAARLVLADCEEALAELVDGVQGSAWRRRWINLVVLLRAVGHVLERIDARRDDAYKRAVDEGWVALQKSKPDPAIFWEFIDHERNNILKEYRLSAGQGVTIRVPNITLNVAAGEQTVGPALPTLYHYTINEGPFRGRDQRELIAEAIAWWRPTLASLMPPLIAIGPNLAVNRTRRHMP